jgi:hypothetical protein
LSYVWRWAHGRVKYYTSGPNDGNLVPDDIILQTGWDENLTMDTVRNENLLVENAQKPSVAKLSSHQDTKEEISEEEEGHNDNIDEDDHRKPPSQTVVNDETESEDSDSHGAVGESKSNKGEDNASSGDDFSSSGEDEEEEEEGSY